MSRFARVFAAGRIPPARSIVATPAVSKVTAFARKCSWCGDYMSERDEAMARAGATITHGMCPKCAAEQMGKAEQA